MGRKSLTDEYVRNYFKEQCCTLLSKYVNCMSKLKYICKNGHTTEITFSKFRIGQRCMKCAANERSHNFNYVKKFFEDRGCILLSEKYINSSTKLKYICKNDHTTEITFSNFQQGQGCMACSGSEKHSYNYVKKFFEDRGCILLSKEYKNCDDKLEYICANGHETMTRFNSFSKGHGCMKCSGKEKHSHEYVKSYFEKQGCDLLSTQYVNARSKLKYLCVNGHKTETTFVDFQRGQRCRYCLNKTEEIILKFLQEHYKNVISEAKFDWCKNKRHLPFDFVLSDRKVVIEVDGRQHFEHVSRFKNDVQSSQERDVYKMKCAIENDYRIIRICQKDVFSNTIEWKPQLQEAISSDEKIIYISKNPELYSSYKIKIKLKE